MVVVLEKSRETKAACDDAPVDSVRDSLIRRE